eukprot:CAMPEP_0201900956 /NCGR_PEP_ID=MMETSP0902-20130614/53370_1 /ASSEMBLY_ACC=CAM_ASM_000551 /TAXON_ID=420261 /ORGANISM="Thalassiosira antarctica, Strain CCMP982" /LENGTH=426 /DNA_ID=CAMNT_0048434771 /DNA_START=168 /DNA_END=1448 /DNA_ORIENTATION=-
MAVDLSDVHSPRDVYSMEGWATQYGMQKADGVELYPTDDDNGSGGSDYSFMTTTSPIAVGQTIVFVPSNIVINSATIRQEYGGALQQAEEAIMNSVSKVSQGGDNEISLFYLFIKILLEYELGQNSPYHPWLQSLPRQFYNGVSMTRACFNCLPPYAGWLTSNERLAYSHFARALRNTRDVTFYLPLSEETMYNDDVLKWAYNVALTRHVESWQSNEEGYVKVIGPMADMINHSSEPNCKIGVDYEGNVNVIASCDISPGSPLTMSLGDPTNPTPIFAQYGFLPRDCATIFCKAMHLEKRIQELGYGFSELLFSTETGEIAPKVWDVFLYDLLLKSDPTGAAQHFYMACMNDDEVIKEQYHGEYFAYTLDALKTHVYSIMSDAENLTMKAQTYDLNTHPRVPVIVAHNQLVSQTFAITAALLEQMG